MTKKPMPRLDKKVSVALIAQRYSQDALRVLTQIMQDPSALNSDRIKAATYLLDRAHGKPVQAVEGTDMPIQIKVVV